MPGAGRDGSLASDPQVAAAVVLLRGEVVVTVHPRALSDVANEELLEGDHDGVEHQVPVRPRVGLGPHQVVDVGLKLGRALRQVGQVGVIQLDKPVLHQPGGLADMVDGQLVSDSARPGVQNHPHRVALVQAHLNKVVS